MNNYPPPYGQPPPPPPKSNTGGIVAIVLGVVGVGCLGFVAIMAAILFPVFAKARENARRVSCESNVKQISLGLNQFMQDHNEKFAFKAGDYKTSVMPYVKSELPFHCPSDTHSGADSYSFNANLLGVPLAKMMRHPAQTVMVYEGKNQTLDFRHENRAVVGFADGHVRSVSQAEAQTLDWKP